MICENYCTGCGACSQICPQQCIEMKYNNLSRLQPEIDYSKCTSCNLCKKICPQNSIPKTQYPKKAYVAWSKSNDDLVFSASGGVGAVFTADAIKNHFVVYGCDYNPDGKLLHFSVNNFEQANCFRSSKYSQSIMYNCLREIKTFLEEKQKVLFIGTPCQVAALLKYLNKTYDNLFTVDLVCHGTPPNSYLIQHLKKKKVTFPVDKIRFRGEYDQKITVWKNSKIVYQNDKNNDEYFHAFYENIISYEACFFCKYANSNRVSDITIGDFWGLGELYSIKPQSPRPSMMLINTQRGQTFFNSIAQYLIYEERPIDEAINGNGRLKNPPWKNQKAELFEALYPLLGFETAVKLASVIKNEIAIKVILKLSHLLRRKI